MRTLAIYKATLKCLRRTLTVLGIVLDKRFVVVCPALAVCKAVYALVDSLARWGVEAACCGA